MAMQDVVSAAKAQFVGAQDAAVEAFGEACYAGGSTDQKVADGSFSQADIDAAVAAAKAIDAQALSDAQAQGATALAAVSQQLSDMSAKEQAEEAVVSGLQNSVAAVQSALDAIKALVMPAAAPAPAPAPAAPSS